jgi:CRP/FNR family transcriptional regulator, polysaccharide utilization system transcription regulator
METGKNYPASSDMCDINCLNCPKRRHSLLSELNPFELSILDKNRYVVKYKAGEVIYKEGGKSQGLLCLNKGKVKITRTGASGNEQIVALKKPVEFIGFQALMGEYNYMTSAVALEDVSICINDKKDFFKVINNNSHLAFKIIRLFAHDLNEANVRIINLTQKHVRARLADALVMIYDIYGTYPEDNTLNLSLKRSDLAALSNMTTANAIRVLSAFAKENLIEINRRNIKINNLRALKEISASGG